VVAAAPAAHAARVVPTKAVPGATVELRGGDLPKKGKVKVAGKRAEVVSREGSRLRFVVPRVSAGPRAVRAGDAQATLEVLKRFRGKVGVTLAGKHAEKKKVGPNGGSISASHDGIKYKLEVPAGALVKKTAITMTPVAKLKNLPLTGSAPAAVQLRPSGLEFKTPAQLVITGMKKPGRQVGFTMTDRGRGLELVPAEKDGRRVTVAVEHFSTPGAGGPTPQDYVNLFAQFLNSTDAILTRGQVETLLREIEIVQNRFPDFCEVQTICEDVKERARESLKRLIDQECIRQTSQPSVGGISILLDLVAQIELLAGDAAVPDCVYDILKALAEPAIANVETRPFDRTNTELQLSSVALADLTGDGKLSWIEWTWYLGGWALRLGDDDLGGQLAAGFTGAMEKTLADGEELCETDPASGRALLERGGAIARATGFMRQEFADASLSCECSGGGGADRASSAAADQCVAPVVTWKTHDTHMSLFVLSTPSDTEKDSTTFESFDQPTLSDQITRSLPGNGKTASGGPASATANQNATVTTPTVDGVKTLESLTASGHARSSATSQNLGTPFANVRSEFTVRFEVTAPVGYVVSQSLIAENDGSDDCSRAWVSISGGVFHREQRDGPNCGTTPAAVGSTSGTLQPGIYTLETQALSEVDSDAASVAGSASWSVSLYFTGA